MKHHADQDTMEDKIARTLLYEGYSLYPYRRNAMKNKKPIPFGVVFPHQHNSMNPNAPESAQTECLVMADEIIIKLRFLHLMNKTVYKFDPYARDNNLTPVDQLKINKKTHESGWAAVEREVSTGPIDLEKSVNRTLKIPFHFDATQETENLISENNDLSGREFRNQKNIDGELNLKVNSLDMDNTWKLHIEIWNTTIVEEHIEDRNLAMEHSLLSTHLILKTKTGKFISVQDPPEKWKKHTELLINRHTWPVLAVENDSVMLSSPIIIYDHPEINPDSPGDLFDSGEIEEYLMLHLNIIPDEEKHQIAQSDEKMKEMLERVEQFTPAQFLKLHGEMKESKFINGNPVK